jgi:hypothetical protein
MLALLGEARRAHPRAPILIGAPDPRAFPLRHTDASAVPNALYAIALRGEAATGTGAIERAAGRIPVVALPWTPAAPGSARSAARRLAATGVHWLADGWPAAFAAGEPLRPTALGVALQAAFGEPPPRAALLSPRVGPTRVRG